jgi:hypothetical protein
MKIGVVDGKGGGIGKAVVDKIKKSDLKDIDIIALGTNSQATANMLKSGANSGATGENAIIWMSQKVDIIIGPMAIIAANSMMGEVTPRMAESIASSDAKKILLPTGQCNIEMVGVESMQLKELIDRIIDHI